MTLVLYCEICKQNIEEHGELVYEIYQNICEYYAELGKPFTLHERHQNLNGIVNFLEKHKFIVSTECNLDTLAVLATGINITEDGMAICPAYTHLGERFGKNKKP